VICLDSDKHRKMCDVDAFDRGFEYARLQSPVSGEGDSCFFYRTFMCKTGLLRAALAVLLQLSACHLTVMAQAGRNWGQYLGGDDRNHYSSLRQINTANVSTLKVAWEYRTGVFGQMQCNPVIVDGILYGVTATGEVFALNAEMGNQLWRYAPQEAASGRTSRGITYWSSGRETRVMFTVESWLYALDAQTGRPIESFGENGKVSLKSGLGKTAQNKWVVSTTPGALFGNLLIMPIRVSEGGDAAPGFLQAFDVRTGSVAWVFRTIPAPEEPAHATWSSDSVVSPLVGGANCWAGVAVDQTRGIIYVPTGSASPDFWGGDRKGDNLYANCLLALEAKTGRLLWYQQTVHHDLWDRDLPAPPNLVTLTRDGRRVDAVVQVTKTGFVFAFDRVTGEPLFPYTETPVPQSEVPGEKSSETQPMPRYPRPFARQTLDESSISPYAENYAELQARFRNARKGLFQPFGLYETILFPGFDGGAEWGGAAVDSEGTLYVNSNEMAWIARLRTAQNRDEVAATTPGNRQYSMFCAGCHGPERKGNAASGIPSLVDIGGRRPRDEVASLVRTGKGMMPGFPALQGVEQQVLLDYLFGSEKTEGDISDRTGSLHAADIYPPYELDGYVKFIDNKGYPAISPPWGTLTAIDLNTGDHRWQIRLGEFKELKAKGIAPTGTENYGGPVVTAGGLLFIAATKDGMFRAFDKRSGELLWEYELPAAGFATPSTYEVNGKQYVVVACGGTKLGTNAGDSYLAFTLPKK
jgi:quinoprotein glucose dehydrogenase